MKCPVCTTIDLSMSDRNGIEIDYCPQCRGVWLDRGELDKIIERSARDTAEFSQHKKHEDSDDRNYNTADHGYGYNKKHKKESFLGDMFDF